ncbi:MAG: hypothetical protein ACLFTK_05310 [Anaerolineales bacterium]
MRLWRGLLGVCIVVACGMALPALAQPQDTPFIEYGEEVTGSLNDETWFEEWFFAGSAGDVVIIELTAVEPPPDGLDPYVVLLDPNGEVITENDDREPGNTNAAIEQVTLNQDGLHGIIATRFRFDEGDTSGEYRLSLRLDDGQRPGPGAESLGDDQRDASTPPPDIILYNEPVTGTLNDDNPVESWLFEGFEGDVISINMQRQDDGSNLDPLLRLRDAQGRELVQNDDAELGTLDAAITDFTLPYTGQYVIEATRFGEATGATSGGYTLEIVTDATSASAPNIGQPAPPDMDDAADGDAVVYGDFVRGTLPENGSISYFFDGQQGDVVTISVKQAADSLLNPAVALMAQDSTVDFGTFNEQFNSPADARIVEETLPADGTYQITVLTDAGSSGEFVLHLFSEATTGVNAPPVAAEPEVPAEAETSDETETPDDESAPDTEAPPPPATDSAALAFELAWDGAPDFDLAVVDPNGNRLDFVTGSVPSGGVFSGDANGGCVLTSEAPIEAALWNDDYPAGEYRIEIAHVFPCGAEDPVPYTLTIYQDGEILETIEGELAQGGFITYDRSLD